MPARVARPRFERQVATSSADSRITGLASSLDVAIVPLAIVAVAITADRLGRVLLSRPTMTAVSPRLVPVFERRSDTPAEVAPDRVLVAIPAYNEGRFIGRVVTEAGGGLLVRPGDPVDLAAAIHRLLSDGVFRERLTRRGRAGVETRYDAGRVGPMLESTYARALAAG